LPEEVTVRYRVVRYEAIDREVAGIGLHPDGNVLSALITDNKGLFIMDKENTYEPPINGTIVMPGSILYRYSQGEYKPTFHRVEVPKKDAVEAPTKISIVAFLNFPDKTYVSASSPLGNSRDFYNDISKFKNDDMNPSGDLAPLYQDLGIQ